MMEFINAQNHNWRLRAACAIYVTAGLDYWFGTPKQQVKAITICKQCPVMMECAEFVTRTPDIKDGIWAGLHWYQFPNRLFIRKWDWYAKKKLTKAEITILSAKVVNNGD